MVRKYCFLFLLLILLTSGCSEKSVIYDGSISPQNSLRNSFSVFMLSGDTIDVDINADYPVNVYVTDRNTYMNYMTSGNWGGFAAPFTGWSYDEQLSAFNVESHHITYEASEDCDFFVIIDDANGNSNNEADVKIVRTQEESDKHHNQVQAAKMEAYANILDNYGDDWASSFSYGD